MPKKKELKTGEILFINPRNVEVKQGFNPRSNIGQTLTEDFKLNVKKFGVLQPLRVAEIKTNKGQYKLIDGERRFRSQTPVFHFAPAPNHAGASSSTSSTERR